MSNRPDIELALDVRSDERVIVLAASATDVSYPAHWIRPKSPVGISEAFRESPCIVVIDRVDVNRRVIETIGRCRPRMLAMVPQGVEQEKSMRRMITAAYPWSEVWTVYTSFGKLLVTKDVQGDTYEREDIVDMRPPLGAA